MFKMETFGQKSGRVGKPAHSAGVRPNYELYRMGRPNDVISRGKECISHPVFGELRQYVTFYEALSDSVFFFLTPGTRSAVNVDSYVISSMRGTLASIRTLLILGRINDAYALVRKYHDSVVTNIYTNVYLKDERSEDNVIVKQIDNWINGIQPLPAYRTMSQYLRKSSRLSPVAGLLFADSRYEDLRKRCNDHLHYNCYQNFLLNDANLQYPLRHKAFTDIATDLLHVFVFHISCLFFIEPAYMTSSDYRDYLECNLEPPKDSQYWVAPFVQELFDSVVAKHRPDIAAVIRKATCMKLI